MGTLTYNVSKGEFTGTVNTSRNIIASNGPVKSITTEIEKLMPIYRSDMLQQDRDKLFSFNEIGDTLYCVTGDEDYCCYNSRILKSNAHTEGSYKGPNGGAGADDDGLRACLASMGEGIIGIFGGHDCDHASLFYGYSKSKGLPYGDGAWYRDGSEVAHEDNFLLATWKDRDGIPHVINLGSEKTTGYDTTSKLIRVDAMLKCFLSQMLVASKSSRVSNFVGPNDSEFVYHNAFNTSCDVNIQVNNAGENVDVDFFLDNNQTSIEVHMARWVTAIKGLKNYLPLFQVHMPTALSTHIEYGDNIKFDNDSMVLNCYISAYSHHSLPTVELTDTQRSRIYVGVKAGTNSDGTLILATNSDGTYQTRDSDTQLYDWRDGNMISLRYSLNSRFINSYALNKMSGKIPDGFFNGIYITDTTNAIGRWTKRKDSHAPDMAYKIGFGEKSIYRYE